MEEFEEVRKLYFGCWSEEEKRHLLRDLKGETLPIYRNVIPWKDFEGTLCPKSTRKEGIAKLHHKEGWTALAFWDNSIDKRPGSKSVFFARGTHNFNGMKQIARYNFPEIMNRYDFPIIELQKPD